MTDEAFPWISNATADDALPRSVSETQFRRPWTIERRFKSFAVFDANHRRLGHFYFDNGSDRLSAQVLGPRECAASGNEPHQIREFRAGDRATDPDEPLRRNFPPRSCENKANEQPRQLTLGMTDFFNAQRIVPVICLLGLIFGLIFALFSFDYFHGAMAKTGLLAVGALWGAVTGAAIGRSIPRP